MSSSVENFSYRFELFLTCRVPDLKLEYLLLKFDKECAEFNSDRNLVICHKFIIREPMKKAWFTYSCVPNNNQLKQEILVLDAFIL